MRHTSFIFLLGLFFIMSGSFAQTSKEEVFKSGTETVWLGLDYTHFKIKGEDVEPEKLKEYMVSWNSLILKEEEKYQLNEFFHKDEVKTDIDNALERIEDLDPSTRIAEGISGEHELEEKTVEEIAGEYAMKDADASLGVLFVMEEYNKVKEYGSLWACFIDLSSGKLLHKKHFKTEPGGIGFRNYWARPYYNAMDKLKEDGLK